MRKLIVPLLLLFVFYGRAQSFIVNEIQVANIDMFVDHSFNYGGWIELYNPTDAAISLSQMYVSDDSNDLKKFRFPASIGSIPAKGFKAIWFDHNVYDGTYGGLAALQVNFKLDMDGGRVYFSDAYGNLLFEFTYPAGMSRCSYARKTDGGNDWGWTGNPTPGKTNATSSFAEQRVAAPEIPVESRFFDSSFSFDVPIPDGCELYFTTNGECPTKEKSQHSATGRFIVSTNQVLRFRIYRDGYLPSTVVTRSFIRRNKNYDQAMISVVTNPVNLYDDSLGVYTDGVNGVSGRGVNYKSNRNMDWERPVNFEYITADNKSVINQETQFYISGGWSRHWLPSSFKIKAEKVFDGINSLDYPFFAHKPFNKHKVLLFRNGGNDTWGRMKDACIQQIVQRSGLYVDGQEWRPVHVFLNGVYLAMLNMREPNNKFFGYSNYGIDTDEVDAFELCGTTYTQKAGDKQAFNKLWTYSQKVDNNWENVKSLLDIDEYINYMALMTYLGPSDWLTNNNNCKGFRSRNDGKFHYVLFDLDSAFDYTDMLKRLKNSTQNSQITLFNNLAKNDVFKRRFIDAYCIINGSVFEYERSKAIADEMATVTYNALNIDDGRNAWGSTNDVLNRMNDTTSRNNRINDLKNYFGLENPFNVRLSANIAEAQIKINDEIVPTGKFDGPLFGAVTLSATSPAGYNFVGWEQRVSRTETNFTKGVSWYYYDQGSPDGEEWKTGTNNMKQGKAPLGYAKTGLATTIGYGGNADDKYPTYYFNRSFYMQTQPGKDDKMRLDFTVDDGFVVYVNGREAGRYNMPEGTPTFETYAASYASSNPDSGSLYLDPTLFKQGVNTIAVEVHNNSATSTDIYWDASLTRQYNGGSNTHTTRSITLNSSEGVELEAIFEPLPEECLVAAGSTPVVINEISASNSVFVNDYFKKNDWIELYNTTDQEIDVAGMFLSDNPDNPYKYEITPNDVAESTIIPAHGYLVVWADKLAPLKQLHASFKLGNADGECVILTASDSSWSNRLDYNEHNGDQSVGRFPDGGKCVYVMDKPTISAQNILTSYAAKCYGEDENFDVDDFFAGIESPAIATSKMETIEYFTLGGIRLNAPQHGIIIVRTTDAAGNVTTTRQLFR